MQMDTDESLDTQIRNKTASIKHINADSDLVLHRLTRTPDVQILERGLECLRLLHLRRIQEESELRSLLEREHREFLTRRSAVASDLTLQYHLAL